METYECFLWVWLRFGGSGGGGNGTVIFSDAFSLYHSKTRKESNYFIHVFPSSFPSFDIHFNLSFPHSISLFISLFISKDKFRDGMSAAGRRQNTNFVTSNLQYLLSACLHALFWFFSVCNLSERLVPVAFHFSLTQNLKYCTYVTKGLNRHAAASSFKSHLFYV
jgi:hypothetical protein